MADEDSLFPDETQISVEERLEAEALIVDVHGFEGPLDLLLTLSRTQKVDLRQISVYELARQYLTFVEKAKELRIELAADYLVMAAWLAFLKSRLLLPPDPTEEGPSGEELAAHLAFQLERLQGMRDAAARLMGRDRLGRDFFARGQSQDVKVVTFQGSDTVDLYVQNPINSPIYVRAEPIGDKMRTISDTISPAIFVSTIKLLPEDFQPSTNSQVFNIPENTQPIRSAVTNKELKPIACPPEHIH